MDSFKNHSPNILLRIGASEKIQKDYDSKQVTFSCAANWIDYADKCNNLTTGDYLEGVFAHVVYPFDFNSLKDRYGISLKNELIIKSYDNNNSFYLRYEPTILMPVLCFYGIDSVEKLLTKESNESEFLLNYYANIFNLIPEETSVIIFKNMHKFQEDLKRGICSAYASNLKNLTNEGFTFPFTLQNPYTANYVNYTTYDYNKFFNMNAYNVYPLFFKQNAYINQSEFRFVINNLRFQQGFRNNKSYNSENNKLPIPLEHLHEYAKVLPLTEFYSIILQHYDSHNFKIVIGKR